MARKSFFGAMTYKVKPKKKRPGIHSKCRHTNHKNGKYYCGTKYRGQGTVSYTHLTLPTTPYV